MLWIGWAVLTVAVAAYYGVGMYSGDDRTVFMPGPVSPGHHQIAQACGVCHSDAFGGGEVLQEACINCHGDERKKPFDSHSRRKFTDPRNADRLEKINALECVTCHVEHRPEITKKMGLTQKSDFCFYCHEDIAEDRPSHDGMPFTSCRDSGCHNFHDNRAIYTDFLVKHLHEPDVLEKTQVPAREFAGRLDEIAEYPRDRYPVKQLSAVDIDAPATATADGKVVSDWLATAHARSGVNCTACHVTAADNTWTDHPDHNSCKSCHSAELKRFMDGKHGMRLKQDLSPMTPAMALIPMKADAHDKQLSCTSCHAAHSFDTQKAAVDSCLTCHDDKHSLAYKNSKHFQLWKREVHGELPAGSGVSCATCHMPRVEANVSEWLKRIMVEHNQNATLTPSEKMLRPTCMACHGLGFSIDALADEALVQRNFDGRPQVHVESLEMAERDLERAHEERSANEATE